MDTFGQKLEKIQTAIDKVLQGQSYEIDGKKYTRANLNELVIYEKETIKNIMKYGANATPLTAGIKTRVKNIRFD